MHTHTDTHTHTHTHTHLSRSNVHSIHVLNQLLSVSLILIPCGPRAVLPLARPSPVMSLSLYLWFPSAKKIWVLQQLLSCHSLLGDLLLSLSQVSSAWSPHCPLHPPSATRALCDPSSTLVWLGETDSQSKVPQCWWLGLTPGLRWLQPSVWINVHGAHIP